jgi:hypothetical protein
LQTPDILIAISHNEFTRKGTLNYEAISFSLLPEGKFSAEIYTDVPGNANGLDKDICEVTSHSKITLHRLRAMAKGIADGTNGLDDFNCKTDYSTTLMSYHCFASSSQWFQDDAWLDFNMWGSRSRLRLGFDFR